MNTNPSEAARTMSEPTGPQLEGTGLTDQQRAGRTCMRCARVPLTPTPIAGTDLVTWADEHARVCTPTIFWLTPPCPPWCREWHDEDDGGEDRTHQSEDHLLMPGDQAFRCAPQAPIWASQAPMRASWWMRMWIEITSTESTVDIRLKII